MATIANLESGSSVRDKLNKQMNRYATASGTNTYTASLSSGVTLADNPTIRILFTNANTSAAPTLNLNGGGAVLIKKAGSTSLSIGDILAGTIYTLTFDGTFWQSDIGIAGQTFTWVPVFTGYSADPTVVIASYRIISTRVDFKLQLGFNSGTSNATSLTFTGPAVAGVAGQTGSLHRIVNGGVSQAALGMWLTQASSAVLVAYLTGANTSNTSWSASVGKSFNAEGSYYL